MRGRIGQATLVLVLAMALVACAIPEEAAPTAEVADDPGRPNILLINIDALRADHLGFMGYDRETSPFIDGLARDGVFCNTALSHGSQTFVSTSALLTATWVPPIDLGSRADGIPHTVVPLVPSLPQRFAEEGGYETFAVLTNPHMAEGSGFPDLFDESRIAPGGLREEGRRKRLPNARGDAVVKEFEDWLEKPHSKPWFAYLHFMDVHNPYWPPPQYRELFGREKGVDRYRNGPPREGEVVSEADLRYMRNLYDGGIRYVDDLIKQIIERTLQTDRDFVVVVTADHGDLFMEHGRMGHGHGMEPQLLKVPLLFYRSWDRSHAVEQSLCRQADVAPVLASVAGISAHSGWDGACTVAALCGGSFDDGDTPRFSFSSYGRLRGLSMLEPVTGHVVRDLSKKVTQRFDLLTGERAPVSLPREKELLDLLEELQAERRRLAETVREEGAKMSQDTIDQLKALGYITDEV